MAKPDEGRLPPQDLDAEAAVLSAVMLEKGGLDRVVSILKPETFYSEANRRIFEAALFLAENGTPTDTVTIAGRLRETNRLSQCGGSPYLAQITDAAPSVANLEAYAEIVRGCAIKRAVITACQQSANEGFDDAGTAAEYADRVEQRIYEIKRPNGAEIEAIGTINKRMFEAIAELARRGERISGLPTGFERLDAKVAGLHNGELTIVAARPGMGKTAFVLNIAVNAGFPKTIEDSDAFGVVTGSHDEPGVGVAVFSLEMPREQLASRMVCSEGRVDLGKMRHGFLQPRDWSNLTNASAVIDKLPVWVDDTPSIGVLEIRAKVRRIQAELGRTGSFLGKGCQRLGLVVVDYLQLMSGSASAASREQEISEISRGLKRISKELNVPLVALSQLNRSVETRSTKDKRPQLSDLRESGAIEQDADNVIFIYRDDYYDANSEEKGIAELIVAKQRNGPTGKIKVRFDGAYTRFDNLQPGEYENDDE